MPTDAHKGTAGRVLALVGSPAMPGAAVLVARAAQRAGAGLVRVATDSGPALFALATAAPEAVLLPLEASTELESERDEHACVVGPGLGRSATASARVESLLRSFHGPLLLDADGLNVFAGRVDALRDSPASIVLSPHPGEAGRLLGRPIPSDAAGRREAARELSQRAGAVCVLKGAATVVDDGERAYVNTTGGPALATAGAGDVLSGILGAYLASWSQLDAQPHAFEAACAAVWAHGRAGDLSTEKRGVRATVATDLIEHLGAAQVEARQARNEA